MNSKVCSFGILAGFLFFLSTFLRNFFLCCFARCRTLLLDCTKGRTRCTSITSKVSLSIDSAGIGQRFCRTGRSFDKHGIRTDPFERLTLGQCCLDLCGCLSVQTLNGNTEDPLLIVEGSSGISFIKRGTTNFLRSDCLPENLPASKPIVTAPGLIDIIPDTYRWYIPNYRIVSFLAYFAELLLI
jgi:hypothetical protein